MGFWLIAGLFGRDDRWIPAILAGFAGIVALNPDHWLALLPSCLLHPHLPRLVIPRWLLLTIVLWVAPGTVSYVLVVRLARWRGRTPVHWLDWLQFVILAPLYWTLGLPPALRALRARKPVLPAVRQAQAPYQKRFIAAASRRAERRYRRRRVRAGLESVLRAMDGQGALTERIQVMRTEVRVVRGPDGTDNKQEVQVPEEQENKLFGARFEVVTDTPDRYVVRLIPVFINPAPRVHAAWDEVVKVAAQVLAEDPDAVKVDPLRRITWTVVAPAEDEAPEEETDAEGWTLAGAADDSPVIPDGPPLSLLAEPVRGVGRPNEGKTVARRVVATLQQAGVTGATVGHVQVGPQLIAVTIVPPPEHTVGSLLKACAGLSQEMATGGVTSRAALDGDPGVIVEVPRHKPCGVALRSLVAAPEFREAAGNRNALAMAIGVTSAGQPLFLDLARAPHLLVAGTTGSGKSTAIHAAIVSLLVSHHPQRLKLILVDPKLVEFVPYKPLPHLLCSVLAETAHAQIAVRWLVGEMNRRYQLFAGAGAKDLDSYNAVAEHPLPRIVLGVDELADLLLSGGREGRQATEEGLVRLAQKARASGIHLLLGTQKPTTEAVPTLLKGSVPARIACRTVTQAESGVILDRAGAEDLRGRGDMLLLTPEGELIRAQGALVTAQETEAVTTWWAGQYQRQYDPELRALLVAGGLRTDAADVSREHRARDLGRPAQGGDGGGQAGDDDWGR